MTTPLWKSSPYRGHRRGEETPLPRKQENGAVHSPSLYLFVLIATVGIIAYTAFLLNPANRGDWLPYSLVMSAELLLVVQALFAMWTILSGGHDPRGFTFHHAQERLYDGETMDRENTAGSPDRWPMFLGDRRIGVDVFITVYGEDLEVIRRTASAAVAMRGEHATWILDDGSSDAVRDLAADVGAWYLRREDHSGAKAGNVNNALTHAKGEYFAIFDADFVPNEDFLYETVPFFIDDDVAFVQTPQTYGNMHNLVSRGAGFMQSVFYRFIQPGRNRFNAAFCVGTNVIFRRTAIDEVGGIYTGSKSEDVWTSLLLHERGWRSIYIPVTLAVGDAPETVEDYTKQQLRWASGGFEILMRRNPMNPRRRLTIDQRLQYGVTATHYLVGITPLILMMVPPLEIYFDLRPVNLTVTWVTWLLFYLGFYGLQIMLAMHTMGSFRVETLVLATVSFPIYLKAFINVFAGKEQSWHVTGAAGKRVSPFNFMIPQVLTFTFLFLTSIVAGVKDFGHQTFTLATAWNVTNTIVFAVFILAAMRESHRAKRAPVRARVYSTFGRPAAAPLPVPVAASTGADTTTPSPLPSPVSDPELVPAGSYREVAS
jgi:cellulose synthase (UDP-forming)